MEELERLSGALSDLYQVDSELARVAWGRTDEADRLFPIELPHGCLPGGPLPTKGS